MSWMIVLQGLLPLIVFALADMFSTQRTALILAMIVACAEAVWSYYYLGEVDKLTWLSIGLVVAMGCISIKMKSAVLFKFQPVVLGVIIAAAFAYYQLIGDPLLPQLVMKLKTLLPPDQVELMDNPIFMALIRRLDALMIVMFLVHAALVAWAAVYRSTLVWLLVRGVGIYVLMIVFTVFNSLLGLPS
ncbi:MAG: septation protein IspZ [Proteobacteria bacterium]|nr:septation protein IspZ [Pseudomonadota bacterium]